MPTFPCKLDLSFKGDRNYLHGTDIIQGLFATKLKLFDISIQFHKMSKYQLEANYVNSDDLPALRESKNLCAIMFFTNDNGEKKIVVMIENNNHKIYKSYPYNESEVIENSILKNKKISQMAKNQYSFIERVVALNKELLNNIVAWQEWLFVRIDLLEPPSEKEHISIKCVREVGGSMYKSSISSNSHLLGYIFFSRRMDESRD
jgi:hypothetical protein